MRSENIKELILAASKYKEAQSFLNELIGSDKLSTKELAKTYMELPGSREAVVSAQDVSPETIVLFLRQVTNPSLLRSFLYGRSPYSKDLFWIISIISQHPGREEIQRAVASAVDVTDLSVESLAGRALNGSILQGLVENPTTPGEVLIQLLVYSMHEVFPPNLGEALKIVRHNNFASKEARLCLERKNLDFGTEIYNELSLKSSF